jgi:hypothetical protein
MEYRGIVFEGVVCVDMVHDQVSWWADVNTAETSRSIIGEKCLYKPTDYHALIKNSFSWSQLINAKCNTNKMYCYSSA